MSRFYLVEIFDSSMTFKDSVQVDYVQNIELDYLTYNAFTLSTLPVNASKGDFVHITQENVLVCDGIVADIQPEDGMVSLSIRPLQALFDVEVYYSAVSDAIQWLADNISAQLINNSDSYQNRPIVLTYALSGTNPLMGYNFNSTINILSVIGNALKSYGIVTECSLDLTNKKILCNIFMQTEAKILEANLDNVLEKQVTLGDSYGAPNKLIIQKIQSVDGTKTVLGDRTYYLHPNGTINRQNTNRIVPVFYELEQLDLSNNMTDSEWNDAADAKAKEVLTPTKYDNEILLSYHVDDKIAYPMEIEIGTVTTIYVDGTAYESMLTGRRIVGNVITLCFGVVRSELTKKLMVGRTAQQQGTVTQIMNEVSPQLSEIYKALADVPGQAVYKSPTELGLSVGCTIADVISAMPTGTLAVLTVNDLDSGEVPISYCTIFIAKNQNTRAVILAVSKNGRTIYSRDDESNTWTKISPIGNDSASQIYTVSYSKAYSGLAAGGNLNISANDFGISTPTGYAPIALAYFQSGNNNVFIRSVAATVTGSNAVMALHNSGTGSASGTAYVRIVYARNT